MQRSRPAWFLLVVFLTISVWAYVWGACANPLETNCFSAPFGGDHVQHYYSWLAYAYEDWKTWIPPRFSHWTWPIETPLVYGDPIPLASIVLAPLAKITNHHFQYFSILSLVSMLVSGFCGFRIARSQELAGYHAALLGVALALSPPAILRLIGHEALSLHAVLVVSLALLILRIRTLVSWGLLMIISAGIHAYFVPIVLVLAVYAQVAIPEKSELPIGRGTGFSKHLLINIGWLGVAMLISLFVFGYLPNSSTLTGGDSWSANFLALIDSQGKSLFAKPLDKIEPLQWEGFSYLGWSNFVALIASVSILFVGQDKLCSRRSLFPRPRAYMLMMGFFFLYSLGNLWMVGSYQLIRLPEGIPVLGVFMNIFRSTGRAIWPVYYSLVLWGLVTIFRNFRRPKFIVVVLAILMLESYLPTAVFARGIINEHYGHAMKWKSGSMLPPPELVRIIRDTKLMVNATGDPSIEFPQLPAFYLQAINPSIVTNYRPYLARYPKAFEGLMSQKPCPLAQQFVEQSQGKFKRDNILLIMPDTDAVLCSNDLELIKIYALSQEKNISLYAPGRPG
jgi:hypothetical protein